MKSLLVFALIVMLTVLASCSTIYDVAYDYDSNINFSYLKTYDWLLMKMKAGEDTLTIKRIQNAASKNLLSKGYMQSSTSPDFLIAAIFETRQRSAETPDPYAAAFSPYTTPPARYYQEGNFVLEFVDPDDKQLIWRGSARTDLSGIKTPEQIENNINAAVEKILKKFPPQ